MDTSTRSLRTAPLLLLLVGCAALTTPQGERYAPGAGQVRWATAARDFVAGSPASTRAFVADDLLGAPDYRREPDTGYAALGHGGSVVLDFGDHPLIDGPGMDLVVIEIGPVSSVEPVTVEVSSDGARWQMVGSTAGQRSTLDLASTAKAGDRFRFVRVRDAEAGLSKDTAWPGADLDAVGALHWSDAR